jgi:glutaredoxin
METSSPDRAGRVGVTVVTSPACHFCADAQRVLAEFARTHPLDVHSIDIASEEGRAIVRQHRAPMAPVVLVDGQLLGWGRLSRGKLRRCLDQRLGR